VIYLQLGFFQIIGKIYGEFGSNTFSYRRIMEKKSIEGYDWSVHNRLIRKGYIIKKGKPKVGDPQQYVLTQKAKNTKGRW
jgi:hypothetical protein